MNLKIAGLLVSRLIMFLFFQAVIALIAGSWTESEKYWILTATCTNLFSILILRQALRNEGISFLSLFRFDTKRFKKDLLIFLGLAFVSVPLVLFPGVLLNVLLYSGSSHYEDILFQPVPEALTYFLLIAFPLSIAFAELATYFGYIMPLLKKQLKSGLLIIIIPAFFLSIQHCTLPLVFEANFILFRALAFLPFAVVTGISIYVRPSLLPYFAVFHGLLDLMTVVMLISEARQ